MNQFEILEYFFLQTCTHCVLTTKNLTCLRWAGFEPVAIAVADLHCNHRANELTGSHGGKKAVKISFLGGGGGGGGGGGRI